MLILDEPTSGLDPNQIVEIRNLIRQLGQAKTLILSTHILSEVQATCDRVLIINEGKIVANGSPEQLQSQFHGAESVTVELRTDGSDPQTGIAPVLRALPSVTGATLVTFEGPTARFDVHAERGTDVREAIFHAAVQNRWVILELHRKVTTLEEVFHKLTT